MKCCVKIPAVVSAIFNRIKTSCLVWWLGGWFTVASNKSWELFNIFLFGNKQNQLYTSGKM